MKTTIASLLLILSSVSNAEITVKEMAQHENEIQFLNPEVKIVKAKDQKYYLKISQDSKVISKGFLNDSSPIYSKLISDRNYFVKRNYFIQLNIESEISDFGKSFEVSITDLDVMTNKFSNIRNRQLKELFDSYSGYAFNAGIVVIGGGYTRLQSKSGIRLSELNGGMTLPTPLLGINGGLTLVEAKIDLSPKSEVVDVQYEMYMSQVDGSDGVQKTSRTINLRDIIDLEL